MPTDHNITAPAAPPRKRFVLSGHSAVIDPAIDAVRDDLADVELADRVFAPHYARATAYNLTSPATVFAKPNDQSASVVTLKTMELVDVFDLSAGWAWVRTAHGMGYIRADCIAPA